MRIHLNAYASSLMSLVSLAMAGATAFVWLGVLCGRF